MKRLIAVLTAVAVVGAIMAIPALAATKSVSVKDNVFGPKTLTVKRGTTVKFVWRGKNLHNVIVSRGPVRFRSTTKKKGSYSKRVTRRGTYRLICSVHQPSMKMTLRVR
jgi:plastocyanin